MFFQLSTIVLMLLVVKCRRYLSGMMAETSTGMQDHARMDFQPMGSQVTIGSIDRLAFYRFKHYEGYN